MRTAIPALSLSFLLLGAASAAAQSWVQLTPTTNPTPRRTGAMCFDPLNGGLLMYGGLQSGPTLLLNETWLWNGGDWSQLAPTTTPPARWGHRMVFDSRRGRVVTFGGRSPTTGVNANDTWEWDGSNWQQVVPTASPAARAFYAMAFDERRGKVIIYGAMSGFPNGNQTWEYDGTTWTQVITPTTPPGLESPAMVYDKGRAVTVMFGGYYALSPGTMYDWTWEYDGVDWTRRFPTTSPSARYRASCAYDEPRGRVVLYGGYSAGALTDTWEYDGNDWLQVAATGPTKSTEGYMGHDPIGGYTLYFGGSAPTGTSNETWLFSAPTTAIAAPFGQGCATSAGVPSLLPTTTPVLGTSYSLGLTNGALTAIGLMVHGTDNMQYGPGFYLPLDMTFLGFAGCRLETRPDLLLTELLAAGSATHTLPIPPTPSLAGAALFTQALLFDAGAPNGNGGMSNAVHAVLGQ